jgi:protein-L-isoaspartate O-methyltransferase
MPVGTLAAQRLVRIRRTGDQFDEVNLGGVRFVPLVGEGGWSEEAVANRQDVTSDPESPE